MGTRFPDPYLHLAILDEARTVMVGADWLSHASAEYEAARADHPEWSSWQELEENEGEENPDLLSFLRSLDVPEEGLPRIRHLTLDGDRDYYGWILGDMWWEADGGEIGDLSGLEACVNLTYLNLGQGITAGCSLTPVGKLAALEELWICALCEHHDLQALLELPNLKVVELANVPTSPQEEEWRQMVAALETKGVEVRGNR